jgi:anticodon tRNA-binding protein
VRVHLDARDIPGAKKNWEWIKKGAPVRLEIGPRDIEKGSVFMGRRDREPRAKQAVLRAEFVANVGKLLQEIQDALFQRALALRTAHTTPIDTRDDFYAYFTPPPTVGPDDPTPLRGCVRAASAWVPPDRSSLDGPAPSPGERQAGLLGTQHARTTGGMQRRSEHRAFNPDARRRRRLPAAELCRDRGGQGATPATLSPEGRARSPRHGCAQGALTARGRRLK